MHYSRSTTSPGSAINPSTNVKIDSGVIVHEKHLGILSIPIEWGIVLKRQSVLANHFSPTCLEWSYPITKTHLDKQKRHTLKLTDTTQQVHWKRSLQALPGTTKVRPVTLELYYGPRASTAFRSACSPRWSRSRSKSSGEKINESRRPGMNIRMGNKVSMFTTTW